MTRRHWYLASALVVLGLVLALLGPQSSGPQQRTARPSPGLSPVPTAPAPPPPWEELLLPGLDPSSSPLTLPDPKNAPGAPASVSLTLDPGTPTSRNRVGLSFDARELANPIWGSDRSNLALTLAELRSPALRFGGNGIDRHVWWTSRGEHAPSWAEVTVTPQDLRRVAAVADEVDASVTIDLDLGHDDPARAADMAAHAREAFGPRLLAVAIGNEPNGFFHPNQPELAVRGAGWTPEAYQRALVEHSAALEVAAPGVPVAGPGAYDATWWRAFAESGIPNMTALSMHWYPLWDCAGPASSTANPTLEDLTSPRLRARARQIVGMGAEVAAAHRLPLWMEETGPTSCPGTNQTSLSHAQALWTVDYALTLSELGVERTAFHSTLLSCTGGAPMSPLCARGPYRDPGEIVQGRTSYLALVMLGGVGRSRALTPSVEGGGGLSAHASLAENGDLVLTLVDMRDPATGAHRARPVRIAPPRGIADAAPDGWRLHSASLLSGTSLAASHSTLTGPAPVAGELAGALLTREGGLTVAVAPGTATMLRFAAIEDVEPGATDGPRLAASAPAIPANVSNRQGLHVPPRRGRG